MAFSPDLLHVHEFSNERDVLVVHNKHRRVFLQVIVKGEASTDIIDSIELDKTSPLDILTVHLNETVSGRVQIFGMPGIYAGELSPDESAAVTVASIDPSDPPVKRSELDAATSNKSWAEPVDEVRGDTPTAPPIGHRVLIHGTTSGEFVGHDGQIAEYSGTSWVFDDPTDGLTTTNKEDGIQWIQYASASPWVWRSDTGGTSIHGNEKHSPRMITVGGNRSDSSLDLLTGGAVADKLHVHQETSRERAIFMDDFLAYRYNRYTWYLKRGGAASFDVNQDRAGGQARVRTSDRGTIYLSWKSRPGLASNDTVLEARVKKPGKSSYFEIGLENSDGEQAMFSSEGGEKWELHGPGFSEYTTVETTDKFFVLGISMSASRITFRIDGIEVGHCHNMKGPYMPFLYQKGYDRNQDTFVDYIYCTSGRE